MVIFLTIFSSVLMYVIDGNEFQSSNLIIEPSIRSNIPSFKVMDVLARAVELEANGRNICHMEAGQPSTGAPLKVLQSAINYLSSDKLGYTSSLGISSLRHTISEHYKKKYGVSIPPTRIVITTGSSAGFILSFLACFNEGDAVALASSGYPCYRNIMTATALEYVSVPVNSNYKVTARELLAAINDRRIKGLSPLKGLIMSSPSNPTGAMLSPQELEELCAACRENGIVFMSDEIYHGISYGAQKEASAVQYSDSAIVINSFSKYYSMTGWRLGWMVVPESLVDVMNRLSQNIYINAPTLSQLAACEAFHCEEELDAHVAKYAVNRDVVMSTLAELGLDRDVAPADGAFYVYTDLSLAGVTDAPGLCRRILEEAGVALTPGSDFEDPRSGLGLRRVRFSFCRETAEVEEAMRRFKRWWRENMSPGTPSTASNS